MQVTLTGLAEDAPELELARLLSEYQEAMLARLEGESKRARATSGLLICGLQQRLFSSIEAFARTLRVHRRTVAKLRSTKHVEAAIADLRSFREDGFDMMRSGLGSDDDRAACLEDENQAEIEAQFEAATMTFSASAAASEEDRLLERMSELAESSRAEPDAKVRHLLRWISEEMCPAGLWNRTRILVFTEYEDTLRYLERHMRGLIMETSHVGERIATFRGSTSGARRDEIKQAFSADPDKHPVRILLATDAAREGLNLQAHCSQLFHFDVPWNPSRMEQRNGRIDRKLQPAKKVFCSYFVYEQRPEDRILQAVVEKTKTIRKELGSLSQVIDGRLDDLLKHGIRREDTKRLLGDIAAARLNPERQEAIDTELESSRERQNDLRRSIEQLEGMMARSQEELGFNEEHFRSAISYALELLHAPALSGGGSGEFVLPKLDDLQSSWAETMDSLRTPKKRDETLYEWRRTSAIRPVVFQDPGVVTDEVVQLHLEQKVVRRLLGRFLSQGFVHQDLSRACLAQTRDAIPRVVLLGRLALYGPGAARLHEEIIEISARWTDPAIRSAPLTPYAREAEVKTRGLLEAALLSNGSPNETVQALLLSATARDIEELLPHLQGRGESLRAEAVAKLSRRGEEESAQMLGILEAQKKHITATSAKYEQGTLQFEGDELRQFEANQRHWNKRLEQLDLEMVEEPERIRRVYKVRASRIEPVGLVYLWPDTGGGR